MAVDEKRFVAAARNSMEKKREERGVIFLKICGLAGFEQVFSGSTTQGLCLGDRKVRSQVLGVDQSRLHRKRAVGKVRRKGR